MAFDALELNREVSEICGKLKKRSATLAKQLERATTSVALNVAEGSGREGGDQRHQYRIAHGSAKEVHAILRVAVA